MELDNIAQDPRNYVPVLMVPKKAKTKIRTIKTDPSTNLEENILSPQLPTLKLRPNQELLTSNVKLEQVDIVEIDD